MSAFQFSFHADDTRTGGGAVILRMTGLAAWPDGATLRLLPIDDAAVPPNCDGWPWGDVTPQRVVPTATGLDIFLGPDVVGCEKLNPGTPVTVHIPAMQMEFDLRWPTTTPTLRRRATAVAMSAKQLRTAKAENDRVAKALATRRKELAETVVRAVPHPGDAKDGATIARPGNTKAQATGDPTNSPALLQLRRPKASKSTQPPAAKPSEIHRSDPLLPLPPTPLVPPSKRDVAAALHQRRAYPRAIIGFIAGVAASAMLMAGTMAWGPKSWQGIALAGHATNEGNVEEISLAELKAIFMDLASTPQDSPQNKSATGVDVATALSLADHALRGERTPVETAEAIFWLKRALASSISGPDVGWALTQLGTIYATPDSPDHSYVKAHAVWELAATQGDPVAHCFLGALYEYGLGVAPSRQAALRHYKDAATLGACRSASDAVARLSQ